MAPYSAYTHAHGPLASQNSASTFFGLDYPDIPANRYHAYLSSDSAPNSSTNLGHLPEKYTSRGNSLYVPPGQYPTGWTFACIIIALVLSVFLVSLDMTIVATAIPKITDEFDGLEDVAWYGAAFFMTVGGFQSSWGKVFKYFPLKISYLIAILIFELGSLICGVAPNSSTLIIGRAFAGVGAAGIGSGAYTITAFAAEPKKRPVFTGIIGTAYGVAAVVGPLIGGAFADRVTWRWCFYVNLPVGGLSALIIMFFFRTPAGCRPAEATLKEKILQMDPVGTALIMGGVITYVLALQYAGQTVAWGDRKVVGLLVGFVVISVTFGVWEWYNGERSMIIPRLFVQRQVWVCSMFALLFAGSYFIIIYYLPIYFQSIGNTTPTESGVRNLPLILSVTVATIVGGGVVSATGYATPLAVGGAALATVAAGLLYTLDIGSSAGMWIGYQILGGIAWGSAFQIPIIVSQATAKVEDLSSVTAIVLFFQTVGGAFWVSAGQSAFVNELMKELAISAPDVNSLAVLGTGATQIMTVFPAEQVPGILIAYMAGIRTALAIASGAVGFAFVFSLFFSWKRLNPETLRATGAVA
ncbi:major facilitator superfamily domain-containing protein [Triangularia setosa]|uniref:Major facilitator superfamily domain-containing protein n=1 Tax=Triangularia setosa TaxID=2587417 RepID=A0AAN7A5T4_9PEZI|nr:major facilitator superfamily domain-containing protein [Podospora setosa]